MQALAEPLARDLPTFVDGYLARDAYPRRVRPDVRFLRGYLDAVSRSGDQIEEIAGTLGGTPHSYLFDVGRATHLSGHARDYTLALLSFHNRRIGPSLAVEEAHTFAEAILRMSVPKDVGAETFAVCRARRERSPLGRTRQ